MRKFISKVLSWYRTKLRESSWKASQNIHAKFSIVNSNIFVMHKLREILYIINE